MATDKQRTKKFRAERTQQLRRRTRIQRDTLKELDRLLNEGLDRARLTLATAPTDWEQFFLPQMQQQISQALNEIGTTASGVLSGSANKAWAAGIDLIEQPLAAGGVRLAGLLPEINTGQLQAMRAFMTERIRDVTLTAANAINSELGLVAIGAQSQGNAITNITTLLREKSRRRAITIVRTELGRTYSVAADQRLQQASELLPQLQKEWRRSGKLHERPHHRIINGQIRDVDKKFTLGNGVELRFPRDPRASAAETINCGCESLPFMEEWDVTGVALAA
ncbi:MAG: hypothetical protein FVQ79_00655 [Planctomycetes bacterium]|nr:hypothetical protein [Planctomycetota bacterium]